MAGQAREPGMHQFQRRAAAIGGTAVDELDGIDRDPVVAHHLGHRGVRLRERVQFLAHHQIAVRGECGPGIEIKRDAFVEAVGVQADGRGARVVEFHVLRVVGGAKRLVGGVHELVDGDLPITQNTQRKPR